MTSPLLYIKVLKKALSKFTLNHVQKTTIIFRAIQIQNTWYNNANYMTFMSRRLHNNIRACRYNIVILILTSRWKRNNQNTYFVSFLFCLWKSLSLIFRRSSSIHFRLSTAPKLTTFIVSNNNASLISLSSLASVWKLGEWFTWKQHNVETTCVSAVICWNYNKLDFICLALRGRALNNYFGHPLIPSYPHFCINLRVKNGSNLMTSSVIARIMKYV